MWDYPLLHCLPCLLYTSSTGKQAVYPERLPLCASGTGGEIPTAAGSPTAAGRYRRGSRRHDFAGRGQAVYRQGLRLYFHWRDAGLDQERYAGKSAGDRQPAGKAAARLRHRSHFAVPVIKGTLILSFSHF